MICHHDVSRKKYGDQQGCRLYPPEALLEERGERVSAAARSTDNAWKEERDKKGGQKLTWSPG